MPASAPSGSQAISAPGSQSVQPTSTLNPTTATGQTAAAPNASNTLRATVRLVVLDMVVVDKQGNAVTNLTRDDFRVQEDGEEQTIRNFDAPGRYIPASDVTISSTTELDQLAPRAPVNIILLDEFNTRFEDMAFARYSLKMWR